MTGGESVALPPGFSLRAFDDVGSTMTEARSLAEGGAPSGMVVWAKSQQQGRARHGKQWVSAVGNLYTTTVLRPGVPPAQAANLGFVTALAVADVVDTALGTGRALLKWPNDVLVDGGKISGILLELGPVLADGTVDWVLIGTGINVRLHPPAFDRPVTSLLAQGADLAVEAVLRGYLAALAAQFACWQAEGFAAIRAAWLARAHAIGTPLRVQLPKLSRQGQFAGLDDDGALLLQDEAGGLCRVTAGDVFAAV